MEDESAAVPAPPAAPPPRPPAATPSPKVPVPRPPPAGRPMRQSAPTPPIPVQLAGPPAAPPPAPPAVPPPPAAVPPAPPSPPAVIVGAPVVPVSSPTPVSGAPLQPGVATSGTAIASVAPPSVVPPPAVPALRPSAPTPAPPALRPSAPTAQAAAHAEGPELLRELAASIEAELQRTPDDARAARLLYELGRIHEEHLGDGRRAASYFLEAFKRNPDYLPAIAAARRSVLARASYMQAVQLFDAELRATADATRKSELLVDKGRIYEDRLGNREAARECYVGAVEIDRTNTVALKALEQLLAREEAWQALAEHYGRVGNAFAKDAALRSTVETTRARLSEGRLENVEGAVELYQVALERDPQNPSALDALKRLHQRQRRWKDLVQVLEQEVTQSDDPSTQTFDLYRIGRLLAERLGQTDKAVQYLEKARLLDPLNLLVLGELARLYEEMGRWTELAGVYRKQVEATVDQNERLALCHRLGSVFDERLQREEEAIEWLRRALAISPTYLPALQALGKLYQKRAMFKDLIAMHLAEVERTEEPRRRAAGFYRIGEILESEINDADGAVEQFARALSTDPTCVPAFKALGRLYATQGRFRELAEMYERQIEHSQDRGWTISYLEKTGALWEDRLGDLDRAADAYRRILELEADNLGAMHALQRVYERAERWTDLVKMLEREAERTPGEHVVSILQRIGEVLEDKIGDRDAALATYRRVLAIDPRFPPVLKALGRLYYARGRWDDLLEMYRKELEVVGTREETVPLLFKMGEIYGERLAREDDAIRCYQEALSVDPSYQPALAALSRIWRERGSWDKLVELLEAEATSHTRPEQRVLAYFRIGEILEERMGRDDLALDAYQQALRAVPTHVPSLDALARIHAARGDWHALVEILGKQADASSDPPHAVRALVRQAEVWWDHVKEPARAVECYERVLTIQDRHVGALSALEPLYIRLGRWDKLAMVYGKLSVITEDPGARVAVLHELARTLEHRIQPPEDPTPVYKLILQIRPHDGPALRALERVALASGDATTLAMVLERLIEISTDASLEATYLCRLGEAFERLGDPGAADAFRKSLQKDPDSLSAARGLARIAAASGDALTLAEAARREALVSRDSSTAARALVRAASILIDQAGRPDEAAADLEKALDLDPDNAEAAQRLEQVLWDRGDQVRLADIASKVASQAKDPARLVHLHSMVARVQRDVLGNVPAAISAFNRVLRADGNHVPTLIALAEIYLGQSEWNEAVTIYSRVVQVATDPKVLERAHLRLASVWDEKLGDPRRAIGSLQNVLDLDPYNRQALSHLAEAFLRLGEPQRAVDALTRLVEATPEATGKVDGLLRLAQVYLDSVGDTNIGTEILRRTMRIEAQANLGRRALTRLSELYARLGDWEGLAGAYRTQLESVPADDARAEQLHRELGRVLATHLGRTEEAIAHFRRSVSLDPRNEESRVALASLYKKLERFDEAIAEHRELLRDDPFRLESYRELRRLWERVRRPDASFLAESVLHYFRVADEVEEYSFRQRHKRRSSPAMAAVSAVDMRNILAHAGERHAGRDLLEEIADHMGKLLPPDLDGYGLTTRDRIRAGADHPLRTLAEQAAAVLGAGPFDLYVHRMRGRGAVVENTEPYAVIVPASVMEVGEREQLFVFGRLMSRIATKTFLIDKLTPRELEVHLAAATRLVVPGFGEGLVNEEYLEDRAKRIGRAISRKSRKAIETLARTYASAPPLDFPAWVRAMDRTAARAGLLVCEDVGTALDHIKRSDKDLVGLPMTTTQEMVGCLRRSDAVVDLLRFLLSDEHTTLRASLGFALTG